LISDFPIYWPPAVLVNMTGSRRISDLGRAGASALASAACA
jgi:hypothetical protein